MSGRPGPDTEGRPWGTLTVLDGTRTEVAAGGAVDIPVGCSHRIENPTSDDVVFVEVQRGDYFGEDDIVRLEDDFGRVDS
jgi:mannose-6-phosphate isomerase